MSTGIQTTRRHTVKAPAISGNQKNSNSSAAPVVRQAMPLFMELPEDLQHWIFKIMCPQDARGYGYVSQFRAFRDLVNRLPLVCKRGTEWSKKVISMLDSNQRYILNLDRQRTLKQAYENLYFDPASTRNAVVSGIYLLSKYLENFPVLDLTRMHSGMVKNLLESHFQTFVTRRIQAECLYRGDVADYWTTLIGFLQRHNNVSPRPDMKVGGDFNYDEDRGFDYSPVANALKVYKNSQDHVNVSFRLSCSVKDAEDVERLFNALKTGVVTHCEVDVDMDVNMKDELAAAKFCEFVQSLYSPLTVSRSLEVFTLHINACEKLPYAVKALKNNDHLETLNIGCRAGSTDGLNKLTGAVGELRSLKALGLDLWDAAGNPGQFLEVNALLRELAERYPSIEVTEPAPVPQPLPPPRPQAQPQVYAAKALNE